MSIYTYAYNYTCTRKSNAIIPNWRDCEPNRTACPLFHRVLYFLTRKSRTYFRHCISFGVRRGCVMYVFAKVKVELQCVPSRGHSYSDSSAWNSQVSAHFYYGIPRRALLYRAWKQRIRRCAWLLTARDDSFHMLIWVRSDNGHSRRSSPPLDDLTFRHDLVKIKINCVNIWHTKRFLKTVFLHNHFLLGKSVRAVK